MSIKLIIFDFDGTLGDTRRNIVTTMQMAIKEMQLPERREAECASTNSSMFQLQFGVKDTFDYLDDSHNSVKTSKFAT